METQISGKQWLGTHKQADYLIIYFIPQFSTATDRKKRLCLTNNLQIMDSWDLQTEKHASLWSGIMGCETEWCVYQIMKKDLMFWGN